MNRPPLVVLWRAFLRQMIDHALDMKDEEWFMELTNELKELEK